MDLYDTGLLILAQVSHSEVTKSHHMLNEQINKRDAQNK